MNLTNISTLKPFGRFCVSLGMIPTSYKESMSYEEQLLWLCNYLETEVIPKYNENVETINELIVLYNQLKDYVDNYFENLDVQEEINNKLDEMAESGTLQNIIITYLQDNTEFVFNTVADMKASVDLLDGNRVKTLGYYSINDEGNAYYIVSDNDYSETANDGNIIALQNNLYAILIPNGEVNVKQFGCYGTGDVNDTTKFNNALQYAVTYKNKLYVNTGNYAINSQLSVLLQNEEKFEMYGNGIQNTKLTFTSSVGLYFNRGTVILHDLRIDGNDNNIGLKLGSENPDNIDDSIHWSNIYNLQIRHCKIGIGLGNVFDSIFENIDIFYLYNTTYNYGIRSLEDNNANATLNNVVINRLHIEDMNEGTAVAFNTFNNVTSTVINNLHIEPRNLKCKFMDLKNNNEITFNNSTFILANNNQDPSTHLASSFILDNCRNLIFNNSEITYYPQITGTSSTNKMFVMKNNNYNIKFIDGYMITPYSNATSINNLFDKTDYTGGDLPEFIGVCINSNSNVVNSTKLSINRRSSETQNQKFSLYYGDDNIIQIGRNITDRNYNEVNKLNGISGFNAINEFITTGIVPHINRTINSDSSIYQTIYGRTNFNGVYFLQVKYSSEIYTCLFSCNIPTSTTIGLLINQSNLFSNIINTSSKINIYVDGTSLVIQNKTSGDVEISLLPIYFSLL